MDGNFAEGVRITSPKQITDKLLDILRTATTLKKVKKWYFGEPPASLNPSFPWGFVEWNGGVMRPGVSTKQEIYDNFGVVVVCKHVDSSKAEEEAYTLAETVESVLDNDGLVSASLVQAQWVSNREKQKLFVQNDYSVVAVKITLSTRRRE